MEKYDIIIVGAGLSAATACALLKDKYSILVIENRCHIGGNCYDYPIIDGYISLYGPHIFHTDNEEVFEFLSRYTEWIQYKHIVKSEFIFNNSKKEIHFPISSLTKQEMKDNLSREEILQIFFKSYSEKMWGEPFCSISPEIIDKIPIDYERDYSYFKSYKHEAMPKHGYSTMLTKMFDGCNILLGADKNLWKYYSPKYILYTGRADQIIGTNTLPYRSINITFRLEDNCRKDIGSINFCHKDSQFTRKTYCDFFYKTNSGIVSYEESRTSSDEEISPFYPIPKPENIAEYNHIRDVVLKKYPNLILMGRLGKYKYFDMDKCVEDTIKECSKLL